MNIEPLMSAYLADHETYQSGDVIIEEGSKGDWVYIVLEGQVKVTKRTSVGMLTIDVLKKGSIFGEMALFGKCTSGAQCLCDCRGWQCSGRRSGYTSAY